MIPANIYPGSCNSKKKQKLLYNDDNQTSLTIQKTKTPKTVTNWFD